MEEFKNPSPPTLEDFVSEQKSQIESFILKHMDYTDGDMLFEFLQAVTSKPTAEDKINIFNKWESSLRKSYQKFRWVLSIATKPPEGA